MHMVLDGKHEGLSSAWDKVRDRGGLCSRGDIWTGCSIFQPRPQCRWPRHHEQKHGRTSLCHTSGEQRAPRMGRLIPFTQSRPPTFTAQNKGHVPAPHPPLGKNPIGSLSREWRQCIPSPLRVWSNADGERQWGKVTPEALGSKLGEGAWTLAQSPRGQRGLTGTPKVGSDLEQGRRALFILSFILLSAGTPGSVDSNCAQDGETEEAPAPWWVG